MGLVKESKPQSRNSDFVKKLGRRAGQLSSLGDTFQSGFRISPVLRNPCQTQRGVYIVFLCAEREQIILFSLVGIALSQIGIAKQRPKYCGRLGRLRVFNNADGLVYLSSGKQHSRQLVVSLNVARS